MFINSSDQLANIFTISLRGPQRDYIYGKVDAYDLYASLSKSVKIMLRFKEIVYNFLCVWCRY